MRLGVLFEHQSTFDPLLAVRFFCHMGSIWNKTRQEKPPRVPLVLSVVLHTGAKAWTNVPELWTAIEHGPIYRQRVPQVLPHLPVFIDDLAAARDEQIRSRAMSAELKLLLLALKHVPLGNAVAMLQRSEDLVASTPEDVIRTSVRYLLEADARATIKDVAAAVKGPLGPRGEELVMTEGQRLIEQGKRLGEAEGEARGEARGRAKMLLRLLEQHAVTLTPEQRAEIEQCQDTAKLERWFDAALSARSADEIFGPTKH